MMFIYLLGLLLAIGGMALLDRRFKLAFWYNRPQTLKTLFSVMVIFIVWDIGGILLGIFLHGQSSYSLPFTITPHFPLEELFFLFLLCYSTLVIFRGVERWRSRI